MKRVALIRNSYSFDIGGAEILPVRLASIIATEGFEPYLLSSNVRTLKMAREAGIKFVKSPWWSFQNISGIRELLFPLYLLWTLVCACWYLVFFAKNRIDVVNPQSRDDFISATLAAKILRKKVIWSDHADLKYVYANHRVWYKNPVGKLAFFMSRYASAVIIESHSEKRLMETSLGNHAPKNHIVIYIGVVDNYKKARKPVSSDVVFISTSRLVADKGIGDLIGAMDMISTKNVCLKICGDGPDADSFKELAKRNHKIEFLGHISNIEEVLTSADVLVHPTYREGFGLSLVEAEMFKLPIIASNVDSIPEIVKDEVSGILVEPRNSQELADAIDRLAGSKDLREKMGEAGRKIFLENFQFDVIVKEKIIPLYNKGK